MTERTPEAELYGGAPVVLIAPLYTPAPVFHVADYHWWTDSVPTWDGYDPEKAKARWDAKIAELAKTDAPWRYNLTATRCGILLRANYWLEPKDHAQPAHDGTFRHPANVVDLRFDHARLFARPCRRCWPDAPPTT